MLSDEDASHNKARPAAKAASRKHTIKTPFPVLLPTIYITASFTNRKPSCALAMVNIKCSGVRVAANGTSKQCCMCAKFTYQGFCSSSHMEEARQYAPHAFDELVANYKRVVEKPKLIVQFNNHVRKVFFQVVSGAMAQEESEYALNASASLGRHASAAWLQAQAVYDSPQAAVLSQHVEAINNNRNGFKRKQSALSAFDKLANIEEPVAQKARKCAKRCNAYVVDHSEEEEEEGNDGLCFAGDVSDTTDDDVARANAEVAHAAQQALPDDDIDEMEWDELL